MKTVKLDAKQLRSLIVSEARKLNEDMPFAGSTVELPEVQEALQNLVDVVMATPAGSKISQHKSNALKRRLLDEVDRFVA